MSVAVMEPTAEQIRQRREILKCRRSPAYFIDTYCQVYDATRADWIPFKLWNAQLEVLDTIEQNRLVILLKARQLGMTWLVLGFVLWLILFHPAATVLLFSRRDDEAVDLLTNRLQGMYDRLPEWLQVRQVTIDNDHEWELSNGSRVLAFPSNAGDSYSATLAVVDEADLVPDLGRLMRSVKPTIDAGGRMILLSRPDKSKPESVFKRMFRAAKDKLNGWADVFLPWFARPDRDAAWYAAQKADILHRTGCLDDLAEQYPSSVAEALAPRSLDKRIHPDWLAQCFREVPVIDLSANCTPRPPAIPGLLLYRLPQPGQRFVIGADPAEGNPTSDDSALTVLDADNGEEVATLAGKFQPAVLAAHADAVGRFFNMAPILCERNNHGHAVLLWLAEHSPLRLLLGTDGRPGWLSSTLGKVALYDAAADVFRHGETTLHTFATFSQLSSIEGSTLRAPDGQFDDRADSYSLGVVAMVRERRTDNVFNAATIRAAMTGTEKPLF